MATIRPSLTPEQRALKTKINNAKSAIKTYAVRKYTDDQNAKSYAKNSEYYNLKLTEAMNRGYSREAADKLIVNQWGFPSGGYVLEEKKVTPQTKSDYDSAVAFLNSQGITHNFSNSGYQVFFSDDKNYPTKGITIYGATNSTSGGSSPTSVTSATTPISSGGLNTHTFEVPISQQTANSYASGGGGGSSYTSSSSASTGEETSGGFSKFLPYALGAGLILFMMRGRRGA